MRLQLEGPDLEALLSQVRADHGPSARILHADRVRSGGVGGFFAKERYEVEVEVEEGPGETTGETTGEATRRGSGPGAEGDLLLALAEEADAAERRLGTPAPQEQAQVPPSSASAQRFASVLARLTDSPTQAGARTFQPAVPAPAGWGAASGAGSVRVVPAVEPPQPPPSEQAPAAPRASLPRIEGTSGEALGLLAVPSQPTRREEAPPVPVASTSPAAGEAPTVPTPVPASPGSTPADVVYAALPVLHAALAAVPRPPAAPGAGQVLVIAGEGGPAYQAARALAGMLRLDPKQVLLVAPTRAGVRVHHSRHVASAAAAAERATRLREENVPVVVAVAAPLGAAGAVWANEVAEAVAADAVWMLADAARKTADLADQVARLGTVAALIVHGATEARDPVSVLALGVPVALLDGQWATRSRWSAFLTARLLEDEA